MSASNQVDRCSLDTIASLAAGGGAKCGAACARAAFAQSRGALTPTIAKVAASCSTHARPSGGGGRGGAAQGRPDCQREGPARARAVQAAHHAAQVDHAAEAGGDGGARCWWRGQGRMQALALAQPHVSAGAARAAAGRRGQGPVQAFWAAACCAYAGLRTGATCTKPTRHARATPFSLTPRRPRQRRWRARAGHRQARLGPDMLACCTVHGGRAHRLAPPGPHTHRHALWIAPSVLHAYSSSCDAARQCQVHLRHALCIAHYAAQHTRPAIAHTQNSWASDRWIGPLHKLLTPIGNLLLHRWRGRRLRVHAPAAARRPQARGPGVTCPGPSRRARRRIAWRLSRRRSCPAA